METKMKRTLTLIAACLASLALTTACGTPEQAGTDAASSTTEWRTQDVRKGVNMDSYCKRQYGQQFYAKHTGGGAWTCQTDDHNRRPISVVQACTWQQNTNRVVFDQAQLAWYCLVSEQVWVPVRVGVNMDAYCKRQYGQAFASKVIGATVGDWVCQTSDHDRRPISVKQACIWQQNTERHGFTDRNNPLSWYCER